MVTLSGAWYFWPEASVTVLTNAYARPVVPDDRRMAVVDAVDDVLLPVMPDGTDHADVTMESPASIAGAQLNTMSVIATSVFL